MRIKIKLRDSVLYIFYKYAVFFEKGVSFNMEAHYKVKYTTSIFDASLSTKLLRGSLDGISVFKSVKPLYDADDISELGDTISVIDVELFCVSLPGNLGSSGIAQLGVLSVDKGSGLATVVTRSEEGVFSLRLVSVYFVINYTENKQLAYSLVRLINDTPYHKCYMDWLLYLENKEFMETGSTSGVCTCAPLTHNGILLWTLIPNESNISILCLDMLDVKVVAFGALCIFTGTVGTNGSLLVSLTHSFEAISMHVLTNCAKLEIYLMPVGITLGTMKSLASNIAYSDKQRIRVSLVLRPNYYAYIGGLYMQFDGSSEVFDTRIQSVLVVDDINLHTAADKIVTNSADVCTLVVSYCKDAIFIGKGNIKFQNLLEVVQKLAYKAGYSSSSALEDKNNILNNNKEEVSLLQLMQEQDGSMTPKADKQLNDFMVCLYWLFQHNLLNNDY